MKSIFLVSLGVLFAFMVSCTHDRPSDHHALIDDTKERVRDEKVALSTLIQVKNIIPLETTDSCLLGQIEKVLKRSGVLYVKSARQPLMAFSKDGKYQRVIGSLGSGAGEYPSLLDFDVDDEFVYILSAKHIFVYSLSGEYIRSIPLSLNVSGIHVMDERILLFALGSPHVVYLIDKEGKELMSTLERNQALRLTRAMSFVKCGDKVLFPQGRSNDILAYSVKDNKFEHLTFLSSPHLTIEQEAELKEEKHGHNNYGACFDGLMADDTHMMFAEIEGNEIIIWSKGIDSAKVSAHVLSSVENDITYLPAQMFFYDNTYGDDCFISYVMPFLLAEGLEKEKEHCKESNYQQFIETLKTLDVEEANPIIIEYKVKD